MNRSSVDSPRPKLLCCYCSKHRQYVTLSNTFERIFLRDRSNSRFRHRIMNTIGINCAPKPTCLSLAFMLLACLSYGPMADANNTSYSSLVRAISRHKIIWQWSAGPCHSAMLMNSTNGLTIWSMLPVGSAKNMVNWEMNGTDGLSMAHTMDSFQHIPYHRPLIPSPSGVITPGFLSGPGVGFQSSLHPTPRAGSGGT